jgi:hypothetical protein
MRAKAHRGVKAEQSVLRRVTACAAMTDDGEFS